MRKSRLKILPARCLAQLGFLLLYLACPILGEMSRAQPDHGLAASLTLHVLEHCSSPPKDPGDGSCSPVPEDTKVMTRNENGHVTYSVATHILNLATKCAPEDQPLSEQSSKVTTVTLVPRRLLAARSKLPAQEPIKTLPKRQFRHRSLKRDADINVRDSSMIAEQKLVHSERDALRRSTNVVRRLADERRNMRTEVTRISNRIGTENLRSITSEMLNSRNLNHDALRSKNSRDAKRTVQGESRRLRRVSYSRVAPSDIRNKLESFERSGNIRRHSPLSTEKRTTESHSADRRSRYADTRRFSLPDSSERRMELRTTNYESRRFSVEGTLVHTELTERRSSSSRMSPLNSSRDKSSRRTFAERSLLDSRTTEIEPRKFSRRFVSQGSRTAVREQLSGIRRELRLQSEELRRSVPDRKIHEIRSFEARVSGSREMSLPAGQTSIVRRRASPDRLSFRSLVTDRQSRRSSGERLSLQRSSTDRRLSESEGRVSAEQRRSILGSTLEGRISASRTSREATMMRPLEIRRSSSPTRVSYDTSRRIPGITGEQRYTLASSQQALLRRVSDEHTASNSRDGEVSSRLTREKNIISGIRRVRRSISLDRSDSNRAQSRLMRRSFSTVNDRKYFFSTPAPQSNSVVRRMRNLASRNLPSEMRMSETSRQQRLSVRRDMEERSRAVLREVSLSEIRERVRASREGRIESPARFSRRARSLEERSAGRRTLNIERRDVIISRDQDSTVERLSKARVIMERRDTRRTVSDRSFGDRRFAFRTSSRSSDPLLTSSRVGERHRMLDHSVLESFNFRSRSAERENRRATSYGSSRREILEDRSLGRISRENSHGLLRLRRADSARNAGRRATTMRTAVMRDSTRTQDERYISRLNRRTSMETLISADRRNMHRMSIFRSAEVQDTRITMVDSMRLRDTPRRLEQINHNARTVGLRSLERTNNYRTNSVSVEREERQNVVATRRNSQRDNRFNQQLKTIPAGYFLRRNARTVTPDAIRRQSANRQNTLILRELRTTQRQNHQSRRYSRSSEVREDRIYMLFADRKNTRGVSRQSTDGTMSVVRYGRTSDSMRVTRNSKSRNYALTRERREYSNYVRFSRKTALHQELTQKSQRYESPVFRKLAVHDNSLIASKTDNYRTPEITVENATAKTDMVREVTVEGFNKCNSSWLKDMTAAFSIKWHTGALWQQIFLILATLSSTKTGCIDTITEKVSSYLFDSENMDIIGATKTATSYDRDNLLGTVIGGGAAAAALLLFSTRTK